MSFFDRNNILSTLDGSNQIDIELGCGDRKRNINAIGIDLLDRPGVDIVGDIYDVLAAFPDGSVNAVYSYHFIEHVPDVPLLLAELARVVKINGCVEFVAPHFSNPYFYSDPTHRSFFGLYTFCYYADESPFKRHVPTYGYKPLFNVKSVKLNFKSPRPFYIRYALKRSIGLFFNSCNYLKELYEENFCYFFPCYEVRYILKRKVIEN